MSRGTGGRRGRDDEGEGDAVERWGRRCERAVLIGVMNDPLIEAPGPVGEYESLNPTSKRGRLLSTAKTPIAVH